MALQLSLNKQKQNMQGLGALMNLLPEGNVGLAIKVVLALAGIFWWTSAPGADEAM